MSGVLESDRAAGHRRAERHAGVCAAGQDQSPSDGSRLGEKGRAGAATGGGQRERGDAAPVKNGIRKSALQITPADGRTGVRDHQVGAGISAVFAARGQEGLPGMGMGLPGLQRAEFAHAGSGPEYGGVEVKRGVKAPFRSLFGLQLWHGARGSAGFAANRVSEPLVIPSFYGCCEYHDAPGFNAKEAMQNNLNNSRFAV